MRSLYFRNFLATATMVFVSFLLLGSSFLFLGRSYFIDERRNSMVASAEVVVRVATAFSREESLQGWFLRVNISSIAQATGNHIFISDAAGYVVACSDMEIVCPHLGQSLDSSVMKALRDEGELNLITTLGGFFAESHYVVAIPLMDQTASAAQTYVFVASSTATFLSTWDSFLPLFFTIAMSVLTLAVILSFLYSKRLSRPLREIAYAARAFGHGAFSIRVRDEGRVDELGELTASFNTMADSLEKAEKLRREFVANVSHELKTPMTTIAGFADGILDGTIPPENQSKYLTTISEETKRLSRLVRRMLELSQLQASGKENLRQKSFDICDVLCRVIVYYEDKITERGLDVEALLPEEGIETLGDADAITQVVYNLLDNAVKFAASGTTLTLALWKQGGKAYVSVRNRGETIEPEDIPHLFDRFHKADRSRSRDRDGVGLGLYIVRSILHNHGEDIAVTSCDGVTEFVFTLTLKKEPRAATKTSES